MNNDTKILLFAGAIAILIEWLAIAFDFTKGTPAILAVVTFMLIYFMGKLERIENKLDELNKRKGK